MWGETVWKTKLFGKPVVQTSEKSPWLFGKKTLPIEVVFFKERAAG